MKLLINFKQVKTHLQSKANVKIAVGHQHQHAGTFHAFRSLYKQNGFYGLWRGMSTMVPRIAMASATQLTSFEVIHGIFNF
jgi:solute carrier family 25 protein 34/35